MLPARLRLSHEDPGPWSWWSGGSDPPSFAGAAGRRREERSSLSIFSVTRVRRARLSIPTCHWLERKQAELPSEPVSFPSR